MKSFRRRLALVIAPALAFALLGNAYLSHRDAQELAGTIFDRLLEAELRLLASRVQVRGSAATMEGGEAVGQLLVAGGPSRTSEVLYAVFDSEERLLAGEGGIPAPRRAAEGRTAFHDVRYRGAALRVAAADARAASGESVRLVIAHSTAARTALGRRMLRAEMGRQAVLACLVVAAGWLALVLVRRMLAALADPIAQRDAENLAPLALDGVPAEARPLVEAINAHLWRIQRLLEASRRFAADVAHQLRTPLTLLGAQAQYSLRQTDPAEMRRMIEGVSNASRSAQRLCNQMLSLSRVEAAAGAMRDSVRLDLAVLLRETALDVGTLALEKRVDLAYVGTAPTVPVVGNEVMLRELFSNLIDNALRYTPEGGQVSVAAAVEGDDAVAVVQDTGPGIPAAARASMFQRFHRRLDRSGAQGSGLGLAIVHQICVAHGGTVRMDDGPGGTGLVVTVRLPSAGPAAPPSGP